MLHDDMLTDKVQVVIDFVDHGGQQERLFFRSPHEIIEAWEVCNVLSAVEKAEACAALGNYVAGFISYEAAPAFDRALTVKSCSDFPLVWFGVFSSPDSRNDFDDRLSPCAARWQPEISKASYDRSIARILSAIGEGQTYQANFTFKLRSKFECDPFAYYNYLRSIHPAPYAAYIDAGDFSVISNSPELFLATKDGVVTSKPMKGTLPRGRYAQEDEAHKRTLRNSEKDRAEHVMIVDLMRSDLGKFAKAGTVEVQEIFALQPLRTVWQMTSTVRCEHVAGAGLKEILSAAFPPGSITGAPKAKTMQILCEEEVTPRKVYCGTIGCLKPDGSGIFSVPIRTIVIDNRTKEAECGVGGGVTSGSTADGEFEEALGKSHFLRLNEPSFELLESLLLEDGEYFLLDRHLARLEGAANYFQFPFDLTTVAECLSRYAGCRAYGSLKVRLTLSRSGSTVVDSEKIQPFSVLNVALASSAIEVDNPFVFHKTTNRELYEKHRRAHPGAYDVLLWNVDCNLTEFTSGNVVVQLDGVKYTPPVSCGLLAGTMRDHLLASGEIAERQLSLRDLRQAEGVWLINSVRRWAPVAFGDSSTNDYREASCSSNVIASPRRIEVPADGV